MSVEIEEMDTVYGYGLTCKTSYAEIPEQFKKLWAVYVPSEQPPFVAYQCLDAPEEYANPTHKYNVLIGQVGAKTNIPEGTTAMELPGGRILTTIHRGDYSKVGEAYERLSRELVVKNLKIRAAPFEVYLNDPQKVSQGEQLTKVVFPVE